MTDEELSIRKLISCNNPTEAEKVAKEIINEDTIKRLKKEKHDLKFEIRQLRERVDKLEQTTEKDRKVILLLLQISDNLLNYINDTAKHVIKLENKEREEK